MKKQILSLAFLLAATVALAQAPHKFNYQGVARSTAGAPLVSTGIGLRLTVHDGSAAGAIVYQETHTATTNTFGLYNVAVGDGTVTSGTFASINWGSGAKYMEVEIDPTGGATYTSVGNSQLLSVPYAIYSEQTPPNASGTTNYLSKFTAATTLGNSLLFDNGTTMGLGTIVPTSMTKLHVSGVGTYGYSPIFHAGIVADGGGAAPSASAVYGNAGWRGVFGHNMGGAGGSEAIGVGGKLETGSVYTYGYGVKGEAHGVGPRNYGVYGSALGGTINNYGVYGTNTGTGYAGYFSGNVSITGSIAKGSGTFQIDHPLDPENKYLYHSFVESPDMMNVYNGNIVTDAAGEATVTMPDYFEVLNKDFRYQLTVIGTFAQAIVMKEMQGNSFKIKTDKPNVKVSWQVTGIRQDKYANAHRVVPVVEKEAQFKGHYLHAAEWGQPHSKSFDAITTPVATENNTPQDTK